MCSFSDTATRFSGQFFELAETAEALDYLGAGSAAAKVVVRV